MKSMIEKKTWKEFRETGLFFFINQILHLFGWSIIYEIEKIGDDTVKTVYPARVRFRGFGNDSLDKSYRMISSYMKDNSEELYNEAWGHSEQKDNGQ